MFYIDALGLFLSTVVLYDLGKVTQADHMVLEHRLDAMRDELNYKSTSLQYFNQNHIDDKVKAIYIRMN